MGSKWSGQCQIWDQSGGGSQTPGTLQPPLASSQPGSMEGTRVWSWDIRVLPRYPTFPNPLPSWRLIFLSCKIRVIPQLSTQREDGKLEGAARERAS